MNNDVITQFLESVGFSPPFESYDNRVALEIEDVGLVTLQMQQNRLLMSLKKNANSGMNWDAKQLLSLSHYRRGLPFPMQVGISNQEAVFAFVFADHEITPQSISLALDSLIETCQRL